MHTHITPTPYTLLQYLHTKFTCTHTFPQTLRCSYTHSHTCTLTPYTLLHSHSHTPTCSPSHTLMLHHTHTGTLMHLYSCPHTHIHSLWQATGTNNKPSEAAEVPVAERRDRQVDFGELEGALSG